MTLASSTGRDDSAPPSSGGLAEFFRYHGGWAPGIRLFRRIGFRAQALLISAVFAVPIAALSWSYYTDKAAAIGFSAKERLGIDYGNALRPLQDLLQQQRQVVLRGSADGKAATVISCIKAIPSQEAQVGTVLRFVGQCPYGWLHANGQYIVRELYPDLYAVLQSFASPEPQSGASAQPPTAPQPGAPQ